MKPSGLRELGPWEWPEGTGALFLRYLRDRTLEEPERLIAAELAGDLVVLDEEIARTLLATAADEGESAEMRRRAAIALGPALEDFDLSDFGDSTDDPFGADGGSRLSPELASEIQHSFRRLYLDSRAPGEVRRAVLEASVRAPSEWHVEAVRDAFAGSDHDWRVTAVFCMQFVKGFEREILDALASGNKDLEYEAVQAAGAREIQEAFSHVLDLVARDDIDKELRLVAIEALAAIRPDEAPEFLWELADSEDEDLADAAQEALSLAESFVDLEDSNDEDYEEDD